MDNLTPTHTEILAELDRVCESRRFTNSPRMVRFLRWVVEHHLEGDFDAIREYIIGLDVFDRPPHYDPKIDTIVRVEARRLRKKLDEYYSAEGAGNAIRIEVPGPGYMPRFTRCLVLDRKAVAALAAPLGLAALQQMG